jgi:hypothetical protein
MSNKFKDSMGRWATQSLFLEIGYGDSAIFTLKDEDHEHKGNKYLSLKRLYLAYEDPTEYDFATKYLGGWQHWKKLQGNKEIMKHIIEWREELELKLRSQGTRDMINLSADGNVQASKFLIEKGWDKRPAGRPSKKEQLKEQRVKEAITAEFDGDISRLMQ